MVSSMLYVLLILSFTSQIDIGVFAAKTRLRNEFAKIIEEKKEYVEIKNFKFYKMNRNDAALNITYQTKFDVMKSGEGHIEITAFQFRNNQYKKTPIQFTLDVCTLLKSGEYDMLHVLGESNITPCPFLKGEYYVNKISPSMDSMPVSFPQGKWMIEFKFYAHNNMVMGISWMATVEKVID